MSSSSVGAWRLPDLRALAELAPAPDVDPASEAAAAAVDAAYAQGVADGRAEVLAELGADGALACRALAGAAEALVELRAALASEVEEQLLALAVAVAERLLQREVATEPAVVRDLVQRALNVLPLDVGLEIRLHPADLAALEGHLDLHGPGGRPLDVRYRADAGVERGGYVIETPQRVVDGRVEPALLALYERLRDG